MQNCLQMGRNCVTMNENAMTADEDYEMRLKTLEKNFS